MAFLSLSLNDTPGFVPCMNVLLWVQGDFPVSYSNRDTSWNAWNGHSGRFMVDTGTLFSNMKSPSHKLWRLISYSDSPTDQTFYKFYDFVTDIDLHQIMSTKTVVLWSICNGCDMPAGKTYPSGHLVPSPFWDLLMLQLLRLVFPNLPYLFSIFRLEYPSVLCRFCFCYVNM